MDWCTKIRAKTNATSPERVTIYTIGLGSLGSDAVKVLQDCASKRNGVALYYPAPTAAKLKEVFTAIATELFSLRLVQ